MSGIMSGSGVLELAARRRTIKPDRMNGRQIPDEVVERLLACADWAPTHARTEPWRFFVYAGAAVQDFAKRHAELYRMHTISGFTEEKYRNIYRQGEGPSHILVAWMKRVINHKIPEIEEIAATAAAIQNLLLAATEEGIASFWSTGGMTHHDAMREELGLGEEDRVLGIIYLGYTDDPQVPGRRLIPLQEKIRWVS